MRCVARIGRLDFSFLVTCQVVSTDSCLPKAGLKYLTVIRPMPLSLSQSLPAWTIEPLLKVNLRQAVFWRATFGRAAIGLAVAAGRFVAVRLQPGILLEIIARKVVVADCQIFCTIYLLPVVWGILRSCTTSINLEVLSKFKKYYNHLR